MKACFYILIFSFGAQLASAQAPLLERRLTVELRNESVEASLKKISSGGGFVFSYNPAILGPARKLNHRFVNKSIRQILDEIFQGSIQYKTRGNYIILTEASASSSKKEPAIVTGYVVDESTGERLKDVSIYDPVTLTSTITDSYGYFEIKIDKPPSELILSVNKLAYADTLIVVPEQNRLLNIPIRIDKEKIVVLADSVSEKVKRFWHRQVVFFSNKNILNVDDTLYRTTQVSLLPFVGTNHKMSGNVINDFSLNILGGYSLGVQKLELGGLFNLVRGHVNGIQIAGLFNGVAGDVQGLQLAGIMNGNNGYTRAAQFAGVLNLNLNNTRGVMFAGVGNVTTESSRAPQFAGVFNLAAQETKAPQVAGVFNIAAKEINGAQLGGVFNVSGKHVKGTQVAGVFNLAGKRVKGSQLAGVFNFAGKDVNGAQIAGVLNFGSKVRGTQIGLLNIADSVNGVPIGFLSLVWKGYHKFEVSADEVFYHNVSFRTGVRQFYNILTAGARPSTYKESETIWTFGYGVGTAPKLSRKLFLNLDLTSNQIVKGNTIEAVNLLNKFYLGLDYQAFKKLSLTFGATLNGHITKNEYDGYFPLFTDYQPNIFYDRNFSDYNLKMWLGAKVGVRFL
ncbi:MAG TPA: hypothetical protein VFT90_17660 [Chryseosolibacter sp.]|nr:hypothetical protein [Chryseosolibacter sp.]